MSEAGSKDSLAATLAGSAPPRKAGAATEAARIGPFFVLERQGSGAMGAVYAAYDPRLDRKVALKLLLPDAGDAGGSGHGDEARERLLREARALAKLSHPNVVTVHEVGLHEGEVYVAMAFIEGTTVEAWAREAPRSWLEVLEVMTAAGYGLAAAHDAGIVHRDIKPQNLLIGDDGVVCVADFGLARSVTGLAEPPVAEAPDATSDVEERVDADGAQVRSADLTRTGALLGTPLYMAPEQHLGEQVDERSDQYSFCLALHESLTGQSCLPTEVAALVTFKLGGEVPKLERCSDGQRIPPWLARAVARGLAPDPADRYPDMHALLVALVPPRPSRQRFLIAGAIAVLGLAAAPLFIPDREPAPPSPCDIAATELDGVWSSQRADAIGKAMQGTDVGYAADVFTGLRPRIDALATTWTTTRVAVCHTARGGDEPETMANLRVQCLDRIRHRLSGVVDLLASPDADVVDHADEMVTALPDPEVCAGDRLAFSRAWTTADPEAVESRRLATAQLAGLGPLLTVGRHGDARARLRAFATAFDPDADPYVSAEYHALASILDAEHAADHDRKAVEAAIRAGEDHLIIRILLDASNRARSRGRFDDAALFGRIGLAVADRMGHIEAQGPLQVTSKRARAQLHEALGQLGAASGDPEAARTGSETALALLGELQGDDGRPAFPGLVAQAINNRGEVARIQGRYAEAIADYDRAVALLVQVHGDNHPRLGVVLNNRAAAKSDLGHIEEARGDLRAALAILEQAEAHQRSNVAMARFNVGLLSTQLGDLEEARTLLEAAATAWQAEPSPQAAARVPVARTGLATVLLRLGEPAAAAEHIEAAVTAVREDVARRDPVTASVLAEYAAYLIESGQPRAALDVSADAVAMMTESLGASSHPAASAWSTRGHALAANRRDDEAREAYDKAKAILDPIGNADHPSYAEIYDALATLEARAGHDDEAQRLRRDTERVLSAHPGLQPWVARALRRGDATPHVARTRPIPGTRPIPAAP